MTGTVSYFTRSGDTLLPSRLACSMWSDDQMHGVALSSALAWGAQRRLLESGRDDLRPARWAVDLFRPARMVPCTVSAEVEREGRRICLVDVILTQEGERVARGTATFLKPSVDPDGEVWSPHGRHLPAPPEASGHGPQPPYVWSSRRWSQSFADHQNADQKATWNVGTPLLPDEPLTGFQAAAGIADMASMVTNWGTAWVQHINTDITMTLAREPDGVQIGVLATDRVEHDGIAVGTAAMFDRSGPLGTVVVAAMSNARRSADLGSVTYDEDGQWQRG